MKKTTYTGTTSKGETFSRQTSRTYTHASVHINPETGKITNMGVCFCGSAELARKKKNSGNDGYFKPENCEIVEVHPS